MKGDLVCRVRETLSEAHQLLSSVVLTEQGSDGLWKTARGSLRVNNGSSPVWDDHVSNIGLHTFVAERLLRDWQSMPEARVAAIRALRAILADAVRARGRLLWRWLKVPTRPDYSYAPDYDDTARAMAVLRLGQMLLGRGEIGKVFTLPYLRQRGYRFEIADLAFRDLCSLDPSLQPSRAGSTSLRAVYIFIGGLAAKANNTVDPVVSANLLYALALVKNREAGEYFRVVSREIVRYLREVVRRRHDVFPRFADFSRCYLSPCFFGYVIAQTEGFAPGLLGRQTLRDLAEGIGEYCMQRVPTPEEAAWSLVTLAEARLLNRRLASTLADRILDGMHKYAGVCDPSPIYQHKRLGHVFGSKACSTLFCLEGLRKYLAM